MTLLFIITTIYFLSLTFIVVYKMINSGNPIYMLLFVIGFFPIYGVYLTLSYQQTASIYFINIIKYTKDIVILCSLVIFIIFNKNVFQYSFRIILLDKLIITFTLLSVFFTVFPIGPVAFTEKIFYLKNILYLPTAYFLGRNSSLTQKQFKYIIYSILSLGILATVVALFESYFNTHLHSLIGYSDYNFNVKNISPSGHYGLTWTFENGYNEKRFGAFFSDPLELSASMLLPFSIVTALLLHTKFNQNKIFYLILMVFLTYIFALGASRSSVLGLILMLIYIALMLKYYRLISILFLVILIMVIYALNFAPKEMEYYLIDTITFQNTSSIGHVIEWLNAFDSIISDPWGIGLGTSGNINIVEADYKIGGENQFLIYGVQIGIIGMMLYILITAFAISQSFTVYRQAISSNEKIASFLTSSVKFGLILPLFTSNAESYLFVFFITWWLTGYSMRFYNHLQPT
ncbi:MAG: hypothetical protein CMB82_07520 [Flammeovirgaceae bacterium]|nr:hypothetical protein [Flammeovirgaceae bacterium]